MAILVTGSAGLVGSEAVRFFCDKGYEVIGIDNDMRKYFFGNEASTSWNSQNLQRQYSRYRHITTDIRDNSEINALFSKNDFEFILHTAAQPSHDWAAREPQTDFSINANGTLNLLEATRKYHPQAVFIFTSTNKVYGDAPNELVVQELEKRWDVPPDHKFYHGIDESMRIDQSTHSLFGVSKLAADLMVQEYGRYFGMKTMVFRGGCLTGPMHSGTELHGFLAYLVKCILTGKHYQILGYKGKQVRDNIHSFDLVNAFYHAFNNPRCGQVYNIGGGRHSNISMIEAIEKVESIAGKNASYSYSENNRQGDHIWYISDVSKFKQHYPNWNFTFNIDAILQEMVSGIERRL
jgi:CDP-paratose 2-epimerase